MIIQPQKIAEMRAIGGENYYLTGGKPQGQSNNWNGDGYENAHGQPVGSVSNIPKNVGSLFS